MKLKSFIVATLIVSIVACSFVAAQAVAFYQKKDGEVIQLFPILLTYHQPEAELMTMSVSPALTGSARVMVLWTLKSIWLSSVSAPSG